MRIGAGPLWVWTRAAPQLTVSPTQVYWRGVRAVYPRSHRPRQCPAYAYGRQLARDALLVYCSISSTICNAGERGIWYGPRRVVAPKEAISPSPTIFGSPRPLAMMASIISVNSRSAARWCQRALRLGNGGNARISENMTVAGTTCHQGKAGLLQILSHPLGGEFADQSRLLVAQAASSPGWSRWRFQQHRVDRLGQVVFAPIRCT